MACAAPIDAWRPAAGGPLKFKPQQNGRAYSPIQVPCGYCILCRQEMARQAAVRITHEATLHTENSFITATYQDEDLPTHGSLNYEDLVKFWKRLRKHIGPLRYYAVGEYGDKTFRPHYHACIFGHAFTADRIITSTDPYPLWISPTLTHIWGLGQVTVGALTYETARYTASYVVKKLRSKQKYVRTDEETGELIPVIQPRAFMSRNLGKEWWQKWHQQTIDHDHVIINGQKHKPPKAYDKWLTAKSEITIENIKKQRKKHAKEKKTTPEQNRARAHNAHAHEKQKKKTF